MSDDIEVRIRACDPDVLSALLLKRAGSDDDFRLWLETELAVLDAQESRTLLDPEPFRLRAEALLEMPRSWTRRRSWDEPALDIDEAALDELLGQAEPFLTAGDGINALMILKPVASCLAEFWPECAEWDETLHEYFPQLDRMMARAVLLDGISDEARDDLADELSQWQGDVAEHGASDAFAVAIAAATGGWDEPGLKSALDGRARIWPLSGTSSCLEDQLTTARLAALEAMGRTEWFLNLSRAARRYGDHAMMLVRHERIDEALTVAHAHVHDPDSILRLARTLLAMHRDGAAFELARRGLSLTTEDEENRPGRSYGKLALARWLREAAHGANQLDLAVIAAQAAFEASLSREDYRAAKGLCPSQGWPAVRAVLLARLMEAIYAPERIDILLDEDRIDDAIATVDRKGGGFLNPHDASLMRLARAASTCQPDWVVRLALRMANPIMKEGRSSHYELAVQWLEQARRAHTSAATHDDWRASLEALIQTHRRKHKLRAMLETLRAAG